jgi:hypothetical protein
VAIRVALQSVVRNAETPNVALLIAVTLIATVQDAATLIATVQNAVIQSAVTQYAVIHAAVRSVAALTWVRNAAIHSVVPNVGFQCAALRVAPTAARISVADAARNADVLPVSPGRVDPHEDSRVAP